MPNPGWIKRGGKMFKKILAATEDPTFCDAKIQTAALFANHSNGKLFILHVLESTSSVYRNFVRNFRTGEEVVNNDAYEEKIRSELEKNCAPLSGSCEIKVAAGFPWEEIVKYAKNQDVDLIVVGPHVLGRKPANVQRVIGKIGSTTEGVIQHARCPIMLVNEPVSEKQLPVSNILVAVDYSEPCRDALQFASRLASVTGAKLFVFYMLSDTAGQLPTTPDSSSAGQIEKLSNFCRNIIPAEVKAEFSVSAGERLHLEILKFAKDKDMDLIVMGSCTPKKETEDGIQVALSKASVFGRNVR